MQAFPCSAEDVRESCRNTPELMYAQCERKVSHCMHTPVDNFLQFQWHVVDVYDNGLELDMCVEAPYIQF